jgi:hypothetical protein
MGLEKPLEKPIEAAKSWPDDGDFQGAGLQSTEEHRGCGRGLGQINPLKFRRTVTATAAPDGCGGGRRGLKVAAKQS